MTTKKEKLTLRRETLRDLTTHNAGDVKGGKKIATMHKKCGTVTADCPPPPPYTYACW